MIPCNSLKEQTDSLRLELDAAIARVLDRGWFLFGPELTEFERQFAAYCGVDHAVGVASGTEALRLALLAAGLDQGDEVITVANTAVPTIAAIRAAGCMPVFVDIDPDHYTMDPARLEAAIGPRTRAVLPVDLYGQCAGMDPILSLARERGLVVIEDAAQACGALYGDQPAGTLGDFGCFSFYPTKNLGALGDAGMVVTRDAAAAERLRLLRNYGQTKRYHHEIEGTNSRMDEIQAAVLTAKLPHLAAWNERRRQIAAHYDRLLAGTSLVLPREAPWGRHVYHLYVVRVRNREAFQQHLTENGVGTLIHYPVPVHLQPAYRGLPITQPLSITEAQAGELVSLPMFPELMDEQVERVGEVVVSGEWLTG